MAISSEALRQRLLANLTNRQTPSTIGGAFGDLGGSIATALQLRRDVPNLQATETADKIGEEVRLRDALAASGIDPGAAGSIASAPAALRGALLGLQETPADRRKATIAAEDRTFDRENTMLSREIDQGRLRIAQQQANTAGRRADIAASEAARGKPQQIDTVRMADGSVRSFRRDDAALDQALRQGGVRFNAQVQAGDTAGLGGATTSTRTKAQQTIDTATDTLGTIQQFRETLRPENIGISGDIREMAIGTLGQLESFRAWADDQTASIIDQAIQSGDTLDLSQFAVDSDLSEQRLLENVLAYRLAKIQDPGGRISDADFRNAKKALGTGKKLTSIGDVLARVDAFERTVNRTKGIAEKRLGLGGPQGGDQAAPKRIKFDAQGNIVP